MHRLTDCLISILPILLSGCIAATVNPATYVYKSMSREELTVEAERGDADAQYALGKSWCCMGLGFDTQTATKWYCQAARQGQTDAMFELGRIYIGQISRTPAPGQKLRRLLAKQSPVHAHHWLALASRQSHHNASLLLDIVEESMSEEEIVESQRLQQQWIETPCEYNDVF